MAAIVWVRNNGNTSIKVTANVKKVVDGNEILDRREVLFNREKIDHVTGVVQSNGYTAVEAEVFDALYKDSKIFKDQVDKAILVKYDEEPDDAITPAQKITALSKKVLDLTEALAVAEARVDSSTNNSELTAKNAELQSQVDDLTAKNAELQAKLDSITTGGEFSSDAAKSTEAAASSDAAQQA